MGGNHGRKGPFGVNWVNSFGKGGRFGTVPLGNFGTKFGFWGNLAKATGVELEAGFKHTLSFWGEIFFPPPPEEGGGTYLPLLARDLFPPFETVCGTTFSP